MTERRQLPDRHASESFDFALGGFRFTATVSMFRDDRPAEILLSNGNPGGDADAASPDSATGLQYAAPAEVLREAFPRDSRYAEKVGAAIDTQAWDAAITDSLSLSTRRFAGGLASGL